MFSNHRDALPFDNEDRRIIVIDNPIERKGAEYYEDLFRLLDDDAFIGSVRRGLENSRGTQLPRCARPDE